MRLNRTSELKVMTIWIAQELPLFNFEHLDMLRDIIRYPSKKIFSFELAQSFNIQFRGSRYIMRLNRTSEWKVMTIWIAQELPLFNFKRLYILCAWIGPPSEKLWPFELLKSFHCSISSVSIYYVPESDLWVKSYEHLNCSRASIVQYRASRYIMRRIGPPIEKLWPFEFLKSFRC